MVSLCISLLIISCEPILYRAARPLPGLPARCGQTRTRAGRAPHVGSGLWGGVGVGGRARRGGEGPIAALIKTQRRRLRYTLQRITHRRAQPCTDFNFTLLYNLICQTPHRYF